MKNPLQKGFSLIELMMVVAIIGILAALALPQYQDYTIRARISEGLSQASELKTAIIEAFTFGPRSMQCGTTISTDCDALRVSPHSPTKNVATIQSSPEGVITITYAQSVAGGKTLMLIPAESGSHLNATPTALPLNDLANAGKSFHFVCRTGTMDPKYVPSACK